MVGDYDYDDFDSLGEPVRDSDSVSLRHYAIELIAALAVVGILILLLSDAKGAQPSAPTCRIMAVDPVTYMGFAYGSGVLVAQADDTGYVVTARHVVELEDKPESRFVVLFPQSDGFCYAARTITFAPNDAIDLALVTVSMRQGEVPVRPIDWRIPEEGESLWQSGYGNNLQRPHEYWMRVLPNLRKLRDGTETRFSGPSPLVTSRLSRQGDSGGPIGDASGRVVGIVCGNVFTEGCGLHCTLGDQEWLRQLLPPIERSILVR